MDDLARQLGISFPAQPWLPQVLTVFIVVLAVNLGAYYVLRHIERLAARTSASWDDALIKAARRPATLMLWVAGIAYAVRIAHQHGGTAAPDFVQPARDVLFILAFAWFLLRLIGNAAKTALARGAVPEAAVDRTTVDALSKLGRVTVVILAVLAILQTLGFSVAGVLTFGGIGGIAVGFAAKDMLANFFGGLTIYLDRPFVVGEWIRSPDKDIEGTVEYIGWPHVPNALSPTGVGENPPRMTNRRIKETIGIRYQDVGKMAAIVAEVKAMLQAHPEIDTDATLIVNFNQFGASSLDFFIYTFTKTTQWVRYHEIKQDVLLKIAAIIQARGAELALPTRTLHLAPPETATSKDNA